MKRIAIHSVPRSGSTWLGSMFDAHPNIIYKFQPLFSYAFKDALDVSSSTSEILDFFTQLGNSSDDFLDQQQAKKEGRYPDFYKEEILAVAYKEVRYHHLLENMLNKDNELKVVGLIRDPRAVLVSWMNAPKEFNMQEWSLEDEWMEARCKNEGNVENFYGYNKWKEVTNIFLKLADQFPNNFILLEYSKLLVNTEMEVRRLVEFCDLKFPRQMSKFIKQSKSSNKQDAYSVFKIKTVDESWKKFLPNAINNYIVNDLKGSNLAKFVG